MKGDLGNIGYERPVSDTLADIRDIFVSKFGFVLTANIVIANIPICVCVA
jgi:hypothetical protein